MRNPPAPFTQSNPQQIHTSYVPNNRMPFMPANSNPNIAQQQSQQPQQHTPTQQVPPQQQQQPTQSNNQTQQPPNPQGRMAPAQQPQGTQQTTVSNTPGQQAQQNTYHPSSHQQGQQQQMTPNMQQQQQQQGTQQPSNSAQPQPGQHVIQTGTQYPGYQTGEHTSANPAPFVYPTNQRMNLPNQTHQPGGPAPATQAPAHHAYNPQYMYPQQFNGHIGYYEQPAYPQPFINSQTGFVQPQGYIYANTAPVNMFNRGGIATQQGPQIAARYSNDASQQQQHQIQPSQQQTHHPNQQGHHIQGPGTQQVHMIPSTQNIAQNVAPNVQQPAAHHPSSTPHHMQPQINLSNQTQPTPVFTANQYTAAPYVPVASQTYQRRERKPLAIVDPTTKQATVFSAADKESKENITKSSTQPSISTINQNQTNLPSQTAASSNAISTIAASTAAPTTTKPDAPTPASQVASVPASAATQSASTNKQENATNSNENKKKSSDQIQNNFALQVINKKQETDMKTRQSTNTPPTNTASTTPPNPSPSQAPVTAATVVAGLATPSKQTSTEPKTAVPSKPVATQPQAKVTNTQTPPVEPAKPAEPVAPQPSQPAPTKPFSYSNIVAKPAQTVPKTAIATARQTPPAAQTTSTQNSITITNSNVEMNKSTTQPASQSKTAHTNDTAKTATTKQTNDKSKVAESTASNKSSREAQKSTKAQQPQQPQQQQPKQEQQLQQQPQQQPQQQQQQQPNTEQVNKKTTVETTTPVVPEVPVKSKPTVADPTPVPVDSEKDADRKSSSPPVVAINDKKTTSNETTMPTVVANADNKINALPNMPENTKTAPVEPKKEPEIVEPPKTDNTVNKLNCWTPENKDAKKRYDREFLLSLKEKKLSKAFPDVLINFELAVMDQNAAPKQQMEFGGRSSYAGRNSFGGNSMDRDSGYNNKGSMRREYNKGSKKNKDSFHGNQPPVVINIHTHEVKLKKSETPYIIKKLANEGIDEEEELFREVRTILNKLTPQNLQRLTASLINLPITTEYRLKGSIDIIFEKAIDEPVFSQTYGQLSKVLSQIKVPSSNEPNRNVNFRTMLLTRCQKEFDTDYTQSVKYDNLVQEAKEIADEEKQKEALELAEYKLAKAKRRSLGNIRFIGELFKLGMLTEGIMNDCIERLLKQETDEENIECLCKLLTTIGSEIDKNNNANKMKSYFERLERISKKRDTNTARTRFMILDIIELRKNAWVPRRAVNAPRRIEEIRQEAEDERLKLEAQIAANQQNERNARQQGGGRGGGRGSGGYGGQNSLKSTSMDNEAFRGKKNINMVQKLGDVKNITTKNSNEVLLGPGGGFSWNKAAAPAESQTSSMTPSASFSSGSSFASKFQSDDQHGRNYSNQSRNFNSLNKQHSSEMTSRLSMDSNRGWGKSQVQNVKKMDSNYVNNRSDSSRGSSREGSASRPSVDSRENSRSRTDIKPDVKLKVFTSEEIDRKVTLTLAEYIENDDISEALKDCEEFRPAKENQVVEFLELALTKILEKNESARTSVGVLMYNIVKQKKFQLSSFTEALKNTLECAEDMAIDVPKIATYLAQIIAPMFQKDVSVEFLAKACGPIMELPICADFISETLQIASKRLGHSTVTEIFKNSNLKIQDFLKGVNSNEFLKEKNIQWILGNRERTQSASVSSESYERKLFEILQSPNNENEIIFDRIESEFSDSDCTSKAFIRAIVTAVCRSCLDSNNKLDSNLFKKRGPILTKFINRNDDFELESLFAVQALDHKMQHQPVFIRVLFDMLYDEDIISEGIFWQWKKEAREEGHAISVLSLKVFFDWLSEGDTNENS